MKKKFRIALPEDSCVIELQKYCNFSSTLLKIPVMDKPLCINSDCHNNVNLYVNNYGGEKITGYYLITNINNDNYGCAIYHSIWKNTYGELIDITPFRDKRIYNIFSIMPDVNYYSGIMYDGKNYRLLEPGDNLL